MKPANPVPEWWHGRAPRERRMLIVMLLAVAAFLVWFAVLRPLVRWEETAAADRQAAAATLAGVRSARAELDAFHAALSAPATEAVTLAELLPRTASAAGVALSRQQPRDGLLTVGIDAVDAPALLAWLDALARQGVAPVALEVGERDGRLHAELAFDAQGLAAQAFAEPGR